MSIIRPPVSGDSPQDSWANQVTEAINKGLLAPSINAAAPAANVSLNGLSAATIYLYTRTTTANPPTAVDIDITYDYKNITYSPSAPFGTANWELSPPSTANGDYLWVTVVNISANVEKEIIPFASWSTPTIFTVNGSSSFTCEAFIRSATTPGTPSGGSYNFSTTVLTPPTGSPASEVWSQSITAGADPVYICTAIAVISGTAGVDNSLTWSQPVKMVENGAVGATGATGASTNIIFQRSATQPSTPSASTGVPTGWYDSASSATGTDLLWAASGTKAVGSSTFTWLAPFQIEGEAVTEVAIYKLNSNSGLTSGTYDFTTNTLTPPTGWSINAPALVNNGDVVYRASGIANGSALETSATVTFGSAVIFAQKTDGLTGASSNIIFQRSATQPLTPSASAGVPTGWYDSASSATGADLLWASSGIKTVGSSTFTWTTPFQIEGKAVAEVAIYRLNSNAGLANSTYDFTTNTLTPPTGWSTTAPTLTSNNDIVYRASGIANGSALETSATVTYGSAVIFAQRIDGTNGTNAVNTAVVYAYKWGSAVATDAPITTRTYTFATSAWSNTDGGNSWTLGEIPTKGSNTILSVCVAIASSTSATDNVVAADWSSAQIFTQDGANGVNTAVVYAYKRSASVLAATDKPSTTRTWTFNSGTWSNNDLGNGWSGINPSGTDDLYFCIAVASANTTTDSVVAADWTAPQLFASNGADGATGASTNIIFKRSATAPSTPSDSAGVPTGWYDSASGAAGTDVLWAASGTKAIGATNFTWTTPFQIEGEAVTEVAIYRLNSNAGLASSTYNFVTNTLTPPTGWSINAPALANNGDIVYRASGIASGSALETSATVTYGSAVIFAQRTDGLTGASSNIIFKRSATAPATPASSTGVPSGWYDDSSLAIGTDLLWASSGIKIVGATNFTWTTPFRIEGEAVAEVAVYRLNNNTGLSTGTYNFVTNTLTPPSGWSITAPSIVSDGDIVYRASGIVSGSAIETSASVTFGTPIIFAQRIDGANGTDGTDGTNGTNGIDGSELESGLVYYTTAQASAPGTPSASDYNFSTGAFVGLSSGWQTQPVVVNITSTTALFWSARYRITKAAGASTATVTFNAPVASVNFGTNIQSDNYVSGSTGWQIQRASGNAEFGNITARGALESANFDGTFNSLSQTLSTYSSATGVFAANTWGLRDGFANNAANIAATTWNNYLDPVSNTVHVVLKIRASTAAQTKIISQLGRGQQLTITRNASNYAVFEVWTAGYLPEDGNTAYVQLRTLVGTATGTPASSAITVAASDVVDPGTEGYSFDNDKSVINSGTLDVANIRINGSIQAKNLDIGVTLQSKSGNRGGVSTNWLEFLRIETTDNPDFDTDVSYSSQVTVVSEAGVGDIVFVKVLDNSQLGTEGTATYSSSQIGLSVGSVTTFANTIDSASIQANSPNASSSFTTSMSDSNVNVSRGIIYLFCYRERPGGDTAIGCSASASITEVRRPA